MVQTGLFDVEFRFRKIDQNGDPLHRLNTLIDWESFRPQLERAREKHRKSTAGRKPFDVVLMFKILVLQSLYNLSDDMTEAQILDRLSFMRFLGLSVGDRVPDAKTIWLFREDLTQAGLVKELFETFDDFLRRNGYEARKGQIIDASIVSAPKQRNSRKENQKIKAGTEIEDWSPNKRCQKDTEARWAKKNGKNFFGYKNHVCVDVKHKFIRHYAVTDAAVHDSNVFEELLDDQNSSADVWADSAYRSRENLVRLFWRGYREHIQRKGCRHRALSEREKRGNRTRARIRSRVEHVFGIQAKKAGNLLLRSIGIARARVKIGLRNLAYNLDRYRLMAT